MSTIEAYRRRVYAAFSGHDTSVDVGCFNWWTCFDPPFFRVNFCTTQACRRDMSKKEEQLLSLEDHERLAAAALESDVLRGRLVGPCSCLSVASGGDWWLRRMYYGCETRQ